MRNPVSVTTAFVIKLDFFNFFLRIHNGHRLLLSTCCILANSRIIVGVSDEPLLVNKTLGDLIEPLEVRMKNVKEFVDDIKPGKFFNPSRGKSAL